MQKISALLCGVLFSMGLLISGMAQPSKVQGFLDLAGLWDPSLAFVMAGAIIIAMPFFIIAKQRKRSLLNNDMQLPSKTKIDKSLIVGSAVFGVGWALAGICPGPAITTLPFLNLETLLFVVAMLVTIFSLSFMLKTR
ncbi:DUF6691 family protein [Pseudomonas sp. F1_0610]|uniref:DUF6691 family protein n=1 Tax=Pseudomonas sp. F1_0610 TaxID=3114284 RepID=UPI0039C0BDAC